MVGRAVIALGWGAGSAGPRMSWVGIACALLGAALSASGATSATAASVTEVRAGLHATHTRLVLELSGEVAYSIHVLDPTRLVIDFPDLDVRLAPDRLSKQAIGVIGALHHEASASGASRLVVDLARPAKVKHAYLMAPVGSKPYRFVLDLEETDAVGYADTVRASERTEPADSQDLMAIEPAAGDGGAASGATGSEGALEVPPDLAGLDRDALIIELLGRVESLERQLAARGLVQVPAVDIGEVARARSAPSLSAEQAAPSGQRQAGGAVTLDESAAERALERSLTQAGALLLMPGQVEFEPSFRYLRRDQAGPLLVSDIGGTQVAATRLRANELELAVDARFGLPWDSQFELGLPFAYKELSAVVQAASASGLSGTGEQTSSATGIGDVRVGFAKTVMRERGWRPDLVARIEWDTDSGAAPSGIPLGTGFHELAGSLTAVTRQDPLAFVGRVGYRSVFESDGVDPGDELLFSIEARLALSPETSLNAAFDQTFAREVSVDGRNVPGSDQVVGVFTLGTASIIDSGVLLSLTGGIGLTEDAPDYFVQLSIPIRFDLPLP